MDPQGDDEVAVLLYLGDDDEHPWDGYRYNLLTFCFFLERN